MRRKTVIIVFFGVITAGIGAFAREIVFVGLFGDAAPAIERTFEYKLRNELSGIEQATLCDYQQSQLYRQRINFLNYPIVSKQLVDELLPLTSDSNLIIWGTVTTYQMKPQRTKLLFSAIKGELAITFSIYNLNRKAYAYTGTIRATATLQKGPVFFADVAKNTALSSIEQTNLLDKLMTEASQTSSEMITAVLRSEHLTAPVVSSKPEIDTYRVPSISDVFSVPSLEAQEIPTASPKHKADYTTPTTDKNSKSNENSSQTKTK